MIGPRAMAMLLALGSGAAAQAVEVTGQVDFGFRYQTDDGRYAGQGEAGADFFLGTEIGATARAGAGDLAFRFAWREDSDGARRVFNVKEAHYTQAFDSWDLLVGVNIRPWGVAESQSVLNVLNPRDTRDVIYGGAFLGTPMVNANIYTGAGTLSAYALLGFVPPNLPVAESRQRAPWPAAPGQAIHDEGAGRHVDLALRWSRSFSLAGGGLDVAAMAFDGTSRTPVSLPGCAGPVGPVNAAACAAINAAIVEQYNAGGLAPENEADLRAFLDTLPDDVADALLAAASAQAGIGIVPYYPHVRQAGLSAVFARGDLQLRFEGVHTDPVHSDGYLAAVAGGDYSFHGIGPNGGTLTLVAEYLWSDRETQAVAATFGNDLFLGLNLILNDRRDTRLQVGGFHDLDTGGQLYQLSASTRLNDAVRLEFNALHVSSDDPLDPLTFIDRDNFFEFRISTFF